MERPRPLALLEIILRIDNIVFILVLVDHLPESQHAFGRTVGLALAMVTRLMLLAALKWIMGLQAVLFSIPVHESLWQLSREIEPHHGPLAVTGKGLILFLGGIFQIWKSTREIHHGIEHVHTAGKRPSDGPAPRGSLVTISCTDSKNPVKQRLTRVKAPQVLKKMPHQ